MSSRMTKMVLGFGLALGIASTANAQANRTWVSGVGDDANPCSRTAPCKTFAGAISKTADGGYINVLDPGGYGAVTITKSITIDGEAQRAGILAGLVNGVTINATGAAGAGRRVVLRNLAFESPSNSQAGINGINVVSAAEVHVENVWIGHFNTSAVSWAANIEGEGYFNNVTIVNNGGTTGDGMVFRSGKHMINNLHAQSNRGAAVQAQGTAIVTVRDSYAAGNTVGFAAVANNTAVLNVENCTLTHNGNGINASAAATVRVSNSMIVSNITNGLFNDGTANIISHSGNVLTGSGVNNGSFTLTLGKQ